MNDGGNMGKRRVWHQHEQRGRWINSQRKTWRQGCRVEWEESPLGATRERRECKGLEVEWGKSDGFWSRCCAFPAWVSGILSTPRASGRKEEERLINRDELILQRTETSRHLPHLFSPDLPSSFHLHKCSVWLWIAFPPWNSMDCSHRQVLSLGLRLRQGTFFLHPLRNVFHHRNRRFWQTWVSCDLF